MVTSAQLRAARSLLGWTVRDLADRADVHRNTVSRAEWQDGLANFAGTLLAGAMLERSVRLTLALMPILIAVAGLGLVILPVGFPLETALVALWGLAFGTMPVAWSTWLARAVPDETESGGGLIVAAVQIAITVGAAGGGALYAVAGVTGVFAAGGVLMLATSAIIYASLSKKMATA